jgi:hypothetical protein
VQADPQPHVGPVRPGGVPHRPLDGQRGVERRGAVLEHGEDVVAARGDDVPARRAHRGPHDPPDVGQHVGVPVAGTAQQRRRALDVAEQERDPARRQPGLRLELRVDEADRHDAVPLGRAQQPAARAVAGRVVLEGDLVEPGEGVADVRRVVDREAPPALRVDVREGAVGKPRALLGAERGHGGMFARTIPPPPPPDQPRRCFFFAPFMRKVASHWIFASASPFWV